MGLDTNNVYADSNGKTQQGLVDDDRHVQVDVLSAPLPTGGATEATLLLVKNAVQIIDNFISGNRGMVTEDNSAAIAASVAAIVISAAATAAATAATAISSATSAAATAATAISTASLDTKQGVTGAVAAAAGTRAAQLRYIGEATAALSVLLGEVQANPTANTVLARLKDLLTGITLATNSGVDIGDVNVPVLETLASSVNTTPTQITKTVAAVATPEVLAADGTFFRTATLMGKKAARTDNTGIVYLGIGVVNDTQPYAINPGETITLNAPPGEKYDLNDWGLDVLNVGDGVIIIYS